MTIINSAELPLKISAYLGSKSILSWMNRHPDVCPVVINSKGTAILVLAISGAAIRSH